MSTPYPPHGGNSGQNYPGGYGPAPGSDPGYGAPSGPYPGQAGQTPQGPPPPPQQPYPQQPYPQQGYQQPSGQYAGQYQPQPYQQGHSGGGSDDRQMGLLIHLGGLVLGFLLPLIFYLMKKEESAWVRHHAAQAFNFQMTIFIGYMISSILAIVFIGIILLPIVFIVDLVFAILAAMAANKGEWYTYPVAIPMLK